MLIAVFLYLQVLDVLSTLLLLNFGVEHEFNYVARQFIVRLGPIAGLALVKLIAIPVVVAIYSFAKKERPKTATRIMIFVNSVYMIAVAWNLFLAVSLYKHCFVTNS